MLFTKSRSFVAVLGAALSLGVASSATASADAVGPLATTYYSVLDPNGNSQPSSSAMVLGIDGGSTAPRARAILARYQGHTNQRWERIAVSGGYLLKNEKSGLCLDKSQDVPDADGNVVHQYPCTGTSNQIWYTRSLPGVSKGNWKQLVNRSDDRCLDIRGPNYVNGEVLHVWHCYATWSQQWNIF
jgi:hypothetical protein